MTSLPRTAATRSLPEHEVVEDIDRHRENDGGVVLSRDGAQRLQVPQLEQSINQPINQCISQYINQSHFNQSK